MQIIAPAIRFTSVHACGRLIVRAGLQTSRPTHPSAPVYHTAAGSPVINFSFIELSSTSWRVISGLNESGAIHLKSILLARVIFLSKNNYFDLCIFIYRTIIHYKCGLYHGYGARVDNIPPGDSLRYIT